MTDDEDNLLTLLNKWAERQDENFVTDAFAHLLRHLLRNAPEAATTILSRLTNGLLDLRFEDCPSVELTTQATTESGRPDIQISIRDRFLVYVEVKVGSPKDDVQLSRYMRLVRERGAGRASLVFLTKSAESVGDLAADGQFCHVRWYQVATWLRDLHVPTDDAVGTFLRGQFVSFLGSKGMTMERVSLELVAGIQALNNLLRMLEEVLRQCRLRTKCEADWDDDYIGFWCESKKYWAGLYFEEPHLLCLETTERFRMAEDARERNDAGGEFEYWEDDEVDIWRNRLDLSSDGGKFFGLPASEQMQEMKRFIQASLAAAKKLEVASEDEAGKQGS